jgi:hypothetical protein
MSANGFASFLVGMGNGYLSAKDKAEKDAQAKEDRDQRRQLLGMQIKTAQQAIDDQQALRAAGADVTPVEKTPGDGMGPSATMVGKQAFGTAPDQVAQADTAAQAMNTPQAKAGRQLLKMQEINPQAAVKMQADQLALDDAQRNHLNAMFEDSLAPLTSHDAIAKLVSDSPHDGQGGALKLQTKPSADGKTVDYLSVGADGVAKPLGLSFPNDAQGLLEAKQYLSRKTPTETKLKHIYDVQKAAADAADKAADNKRLDRQVDGQIGYWKTMGEAADTKAEKYGGSSANKMPEGDKIRLNSLNKQADEISQAIIKARADGTWDETSPNAKSLTSQLTGLRMQSNDLAAKYSSDAGAGDPLGLRGSASGSQVATPRPSKFASTPAEKDRAAILQTELAQRLQARDAAQPNSDEWTRASADVQSLVGELKGIGISPGQGQPQAQPQAQAQAPQRKLMPMGGASQGAETAQKSSQTQPEGRDEWVLSQKAAEQGFEPAGRGNSMFGKGEILFVNPKTGEKRWASQIK